MTCSKCNGTGVLITGYDTDSGIYESEACFCVKELTINRSEKCCGNKNCHEDIKTLSLDDADCQECINHVSDEHAQMDKYYEVTKD